VRTPSTAPAQLLDSQSNLYEDAHRQVPTAAVTAGYALDDRDSVTGSFTWLERGGLRTYTELNSSSAAPAVLTSSAERLSAGHDPEKDYDERLGFSRKLERPGEELTLSLHRASSYQHENYAYTNESILPPAATYDSYLILHENHATTEVDADYVLPFSKQRSLKLGYSFEQDDYLYGVTGGNIDPVSGLPIIDPNTTNDFRFRQRINGAYASYRASNDRWSLLAGLRAERTDTDALLLTSNTASNGSYFGIYPSVHVDRILSDEATLSFGASRRVTRPDPSNLDPYVDPEYTPNLRAGNLHLQPEYTQSYEIGYGFQGRKTLYQVTGYYRHNRDSVTDVTEYQGNGISLTTKENLPRADAAGLELSSDGRIGQVLTYSVSANVFYSQIDATALGIPGLQSTTGVNAKLKLDYHPTSLDSAQIAVTRTDKRLTPQGYVSAINLLNAGYRRQLRSDLTAIATVSDLFNGQRNVRFESTSTFAGEYVRAVRGRLVYVGFIYSFGASSSGKEPSFEYEGPG